MKLKSGVQTMLSIAASLVLVFCTIHKLLWFQKNRSEVPGTGLDYLIKGTKLEWKMAQSR